MALDERSISVMNFHYVRHTLDRFLADVCDAGVSRIELWAAAPHFYIGDKTLADARALGRKVRGMGLDIVAFTPEQCIYPINISAKEPELRDRSVRYFLESMEFAIECGAPALLVTAGGGYRDEPVEQALERCIDSMGILCDRAQKLGIDLWMESLPDSFANIIRSAREIRELMDKLGNSSLHAVYDVAGAIMTHETPEDYFTHLAGRVAHVHFTDSDAGGSHLAWGDGVIDLDKLVTFLRKENYDGSLTVELTNWKYNVDPTPPLKQCVEAMRKALRSA
ncbi:sugar phosphate isomerase/epimerase [Rhizobium pusense]|uniref:TIM barrel protein n=2 Tax=Agrobacterium TaxID=357 RepID=A0A1L9CAQ4_9HYPH|nr:MULTISPECIES: sugar phosphate isomerase/epimerase family protein [Rhizobium/Agrobacterium group]MBM7326023.1 TIM barrel protein [Agrobacterium sp. S2]QCM13961.1 TIM barrel protein [Agrobacterium tumefaciens]HCJ70564.1 xylose isomerase [Agrobacterium sp.]MDH0118084.1 sugar phosphate isomerase/epimerase [Agrobacterium pusense]MDH0912830.1 sugar phosphate isomerase/epimerase [Agrobacterium pusense]